VSSSHAAVSPPVGITPVFTVSSRTRSCARVTISSWASTTLACSWSLFINASAGDTGSQIGEEEALYVGIEREPDALQAAFPAEDHRTGPLHRDEPGRLDL